MRSQYAHVRGARTDNQIVEAAAEVSDADGGGATDRPANRGRLDVFGEPARLVERHFPFMHFAGHIGRREPNASNPRRSTEKSRPAGACKPVEPHFTVRA